MKIIHWSIFILVMLFVIGCNKVESEIKPQKVSEVSFNMEEANILMKSVWKPLVDFIEEKRNLTLIDKKKTKYEYTKILQDKMSTRLQEDLFYSIFKNEKNGYVSVIKGINIPTILNVKVSIKKGYVRTEYYSSEHNYLDNESLFIVETGEFDDNTKFGRVNVFKRDKEGRWILDQINGTFSYNYL